MNPWLILCTSLLLSACSHRAPPGQMSPDRPMVVASVSPPEPREENRGRQPHPGYVWIPGYWNLVRGRHVWVMGYWTRPPQGFSDYEPAKWNRTEQGWVLTRGYWKN